MLDHKELLQIWLKSIKPTEILELDAVSKHFWARVSALFLTFGKLLPGEMAQIWEKVNTRWACTIVLNKKAMKFQRLLKLYQKDVGAILKRLPLA